MKKVIDVAIGKVNFSIEDDAYIILKNYMSDYESTLDNPEEVQEIMEDVENRIAELFQKNTPAGSVINSKQVENIIEQFGRINTSTQNTNNQKEYKERLSDKKLYRDTDNKKIAGVCSGIAIYLDVDPTLVRIIFAILLLGYGSALPIYIILWIAMPESAYKEEERKKRKKQLNVLNLVDEKLKKSKWRSI